MHFSTSSLLDQSKSALFGNGLGDAVEPGPRLLELCRQAKERALVSEASGENIFIVRDGKVSTPAQGGSLLVGITRDTVITLMGNMGLEVEERLISRDELYIADEMFMVGTAAEVTPVRELDHRAIGAGSRGPITEKVQNAYFDAVKGVSVPDERWLSIV